MLFFYINLCALHICPSKHLAYLFLLAAYAYVTIGHIKDPSLQLVLYNKVQPIMCYFGNEIHTAK